MSSPTELRRRVLLVAAPIAALALGACSPAAPAPSAPPAAAPAEAAPTNAVEQPTGTDSVGATAAFVTGSGSYAFELAHCSIGAEDVLVHGPGSGDDGSPAYLDIDFVLMGDETIGAARIDLGATRQFQSTDDFYALDTTYLLGSYALEFDGASLVLDGEFHLADGSSAGPSTLTVDCR